LMALNLMILFMGGWCLIPITVFVMRRNFPNKWLC
jgi:hypothetical protein